MSFFSRLFTRIGIGGIRFYQFFSPYWPRHCRFYPTCSSYALQALEKYGIWQGGWLAFRRLIRCHPLNPGGYDPLR